MKTTIAALLALAVSLPLLAVNAPERPVYRAVRVARPPAVDGDLSDDAWKDAPEMAEFTQHNPDDTKPATLRTVVKAVYTDEAIYFAAMMYDDRPVSRLLARRDSMDLQSDWIRINLSPQHDGLTGAEFWVNPAGVQVDGILYNDISDDFTWDAVWSSATKIVPGTGWSAEFRIPYSQLRFHPAEQQTWGINVTRETVSIHETDRLVNVPKGQTGWVSKMAELTGIDGIRPEKALELVPYGVTRGDLQNHIAPGDPFTAQHSASLDGGLDVKYGLSSSLTLTGTVNPDFGQVEVDPAVVNLSQYETFFPEKRPFFTEGAQMFRFGRGPSSNNFNFNFYPLQMFYSRRIGRPPQGTGDVVADFVSAPDTTRIIGAAKLTGRIGGDWSVGVLDAVTDSEKAWVDSGGIDSRTSVEPLTNYFVGRMARESSDGNSRLGMLLEQVNRKITPDLNYLRRTATVAGVDGYQRFDKGDWLFDWSAVGTRVTGSQEAIALTQRAPAHQYDRPDADYLEYDPTRTSLSGFGGRFLLARQNGHWLPNIQIQSYSPGFEVNDIGYEQRVDITNSHVALIYDNQDLTKWARSVNAWAGKYQNWNYGGDLIANGLYGTWNVTWQNYWYTFGAGGKDWPALDDRKTRGGPLARNPGDTDVSLGFGSDNRKPIYGEISAERFAADDGTRVHTYNLSLTYRPVPSLRVTLSPTYMMEHDAAQYVAGSGSDPRIFSELDQHQFQVGTRFEWTLNPHLSFQLYTQPFVATGAYYRFLQLTRPGSGDYAPTDYSGNPDFNFRSARSSAVTRWEFRPGSALYFVWSEQRADVEGYGDFHLPRDLGAIPRAASRDVFLLKLSYWLPM